MRSLEIQGLSLIRGEADGKLLVTNQALSFWGGVNQITSEIIDRRHELSGKFLYDNIFAFPGSKGSSTGSEVILELLYKKIGPKAIIVTNCEVILTLGAIIAEEFFSFSLPIILINNMDFNKLRDFNHVKLNYSGSIFLFNK